MNFPQFWAKGSATSSRKRAAFECWGWSDVSVEEARRRGEESAKRVAEKFAAGGSLDHRRYYGDRPFREEILQTIGNGAGAARAVITRNSYGCLVLNTAGLMFIDVDLQEGEDNSDASWWSPISGQRGSAPPPKDPEAIIQRAREWAEGNPGWGWRVYRTRAGLRFVATHAFFDPEEMAGSALFDALTADALYRKLCKNQKCFRARLTPKPWRCEMPPLRTPWPWPSAKDEKRFHDWEKKYQKAAADYSTCKLVATLGVAEMHPEIAPVMRVHDERSRIGSALPLA